MSRFKSELHDYQLRAIEHIKAHPRAALHLEMSLGKTVSSLTAIKDLFNQGVIRGALVIAPRRVTETVWKQETQEWEHLHDLRVCILRGSAKRKAFNLSRPHHIWVINYESLPWLFTKLNQLFLTQGRYLPFDMIVFDEVTRIKNPEGTRISPWYRKNELGYCMMDHFPVRLGLTGTPSPNGYIDLFGQYLAIEPELFGYSKQVFKEQFFIEEAHTGRAIPTENGRQQIQELIAPITLTMQTEEYLKLPPYIFNPINVDLPAKAREIYDNLENAMFAELDSGQSIQVFNAAALTAKCRQLANGTMIDPENADIVHDIHEAKLEVLDEIMEEASGQGVLGAYIFRADMHRIRKRYRGKYRVAYLGPGVSDTEAEKIVDEWNRHFYDLLLAHPQSAGHGLNLQKGGHQIVWFGLDYALEGWLQMNARLRRQGQPADKVIVHQILATQTVDRVVLRALESKTEDQQGLMDALKEYRREREIKLAA